MKWYARDKCSDEWHGGWDTRWDAVLGVAYQTVEPLPRDVVEEYYEFGLFGVNDDGVEVRIG
jgi:hypothetical protein